MDNDFYGAIADLNYTNHNGLTAVVGGGWNRYDGDHFGLVTWVKENVANLTPDWEYYRNNAVKTMRTYMVRSTGSFCADFLRMLTCSIVM